LSLKNWLRFSLNVLVLQIYQILFFLSKLSLAINGNRIEILVLLKFKKYIFYLNEYQRKKILK